MDLFRAAGIDVGDGGRGGRSGRAVASRTLRVPLLNHKVVAEALKWFNFHLTPQQKAAAASYAETARTPRFAKQKETAVRPLFFEKVLGEILGYKQIGSETNYTLFAFEYPIRHGNVDVSRSASCGRWGCSRRVVAHSSSKGPGPANLDPIMPGRGRQPRSGEHLDCGPMRRGRAGCWFRTAWRSNSMPSAEDATPSSCSTYESSMMKKCWSGCSFCSRRVNCWAAPPKRCCAKRIVRTRALPANSIRTTRSYETN